MTPTEPRGGEAITMQDVRLCAGEGKLSAHDVLNAVNAILRNRRPPVVHGWPEREVVARVIRSAIGETRVSQSQADWAAHRVLSLFPPVVGWRTIDTAPRDGTLVLCFYSDRHGHDALSLRYWAEGDWPSSGRKQGWCDQHRSLRSTDPTHWMPLPAAPLTDGVG